MRETERGQGWVWNREGSQGYFLCDIENPGPVKRIAGRDHQAGRKQQASIKALG